MSELRQREDLEPEELQRLEAAEAEARNRASKAAEVANYDGLRRSQVGNVRHTIRMSGLAHNALEDLKIELGLRGPLTEKEIESRAWNLNPKGDKDDEDSAS